MGGAKAPPYRAGSREAAGARLLKDCKAAPLDPLRGRAQGLHPCTPLFNPSDVPTALPGITARYQMAERACTERYP